MFWWMATDAHKWAHRRGPLLIAVGLLYLGFMVWTDIRAARVRQAADAAWLEACAGWPPEEAVPCAERLAAEGDACFRLAGPAPARVGRDPGAMDNIAGYHACLRETHEGWLSARARAREEARLNLQGELR